MRIIVIAVAAFIIVGLIGHDPWKQDETYIFGSVQEFLEGGHWLVPRVAGEPFMEKPPLYHWVASAFAQAFRHVLPLHDGARLASGLFVLVTCLAVGWTAKNIVATGTGRYAVLVLLGNLGTALYAHIMIADLAVMAGAAIACCAVALLHTSTIRAGVLLGTGVGIGFLGKGLFLPGVVTITAIALPIFFRQWRSRKALECIGIGVLASLPWVIIWPTALYFNDPALFHEWFWINNVGRFLGFSVEILGAENSNGYWLRTLVWFAFPALPLACFSLLGNWKSLKIDLPTQFLLVFSAVILFTLFVSASARESYALPVLVPLSLLSSYATKRLPTIIDVAWDWIGKIGFWAVACLLWAVWMIVASGHEVPWNKFNEMLPTSGVTLPFVAPITALVLTIGIGWITLRTRQWQGRGIVSWTVGLYLCIGLFLTLWLPWLDSAKSYRGVFLSMQKSMPSQSNCVESVSLGESERAMLRYVLGVNTQRHETVRDPRCELFLVEGLAKFPPIAEDFSDWDLIWTGTRPKDKREQFWLFRRIVRDADIAR